LSNNVYALVSIVFCMDQLLACMFAIVVQVDTQIMMIYANAVLFKKKLRKTKSKKVHGNMNNGKNIKVGL
jgi:hypothetical protein